MMGTKHRSGCFFMFQSLTDKGVGSVFEMKTKLVSVLSGVACVSVLVVCVPVAANAAPESFSLPAECFEQKVTLADLKKRGTAKEPWTVNDLKRVDIHPQKGKEYVFTTVCRAGDFGTNSVLIVAGANGKRIKSTVFNSQAVVKSASKTKGIKLAVNRRYSTKTIDDIYYTVSARYTWNTKAGKFVYKQSKRPKWVKPIATAVFSAQKSSVIKGLAGKASVKKVFNKRLDYLAAGGWPVSVDCKAKGVGASCTVFNSGGAVNEKFTFKVTKAGKGFKLAAVGKLKELS